MRALVRRPTWLALAGLWAAIIASVAAAAAAPVAGGLRLDRTFGGGQGFVTTPIAGAVSLAYGATVISSGDIVVAGQASPPSGNGQVVVVRYLPNG